MRLLFNRAAGGSDRMRIEIWGLADGSGELRIIIGAGSCIVKGMSSYINFNFLLINLLEQMSGWWVERCQ